MERAVARGQRAKGPRVPRRLGVDEKAAAKGHRYLTLVCDLTHATVEYIADDRKQASLDAYFATVPPDQLARIEAIAMDMWEPYVQSVLAHVPNGQMKIVFDKYHIMSHMGTAVDTVRKREHRVLRDEGNDVLTGSKYVWLYAGPNVPEKHQPRLLGLLKRPLKTARAWAIKETLRDFWQYRRVGWARVFWKRWDCWATHSRLAPVIKVAKMLKRHLPNVLSYFTHRITNAVSEGLNSKIQTIKKMAYGFRNLEHFKTAIYFHCGGLQLYPEIVDQIVLVTVHPASEREDEELQRRRHSLRLLGRLDQHRPSLGRFFAPYAMTRHVQRAAHAPGQDVWSHPAGKVRRRNAYCDGEDDPRLVDGI